MMLVFKNYFNIKIFLPMNFFKYVNLSIYFNRINIEFKKDLFGNKNNDPRLLHMIPKVHKLFAKQLNKVLKDKSLNNGDVVEFSLEI